MTFKQPHRHHHLIRSIIFLPCFLFCILPINVYANIFQLEQSNISVNKSNNQCEDNQHYVFKRKLSANINEENEKNKIIKSCSWVGRNPNRRCTFVDQDDIRVKDRCRKTCNNCTTNSVSTYTTSNSNDNSASRITRGNREGNQYNVGQYCLLDSDCKSNICKENTCFASHSCKSIKHINGQEFDSNTINLVFVGSGFQNLESWRTAVAKTFRVFDQHQFLSFDNPRYNAFYVDEYNPKEFCRFDCQGIATLLCCDIKKSKELSTKCFPNGPHLQTIVIENSDRYGGAGYYNQNVATTSIHDLGPTVAAHELGHSLFELGDEYTSGHFTAKNSANCDVQGCPKWKDLDEHFGGGYCQVKGCQNGNYYVGQNSFMRVLEAPMGHVNLRFTCCTYLALTKGTPAYCEQYEFGGGLLDYCQQDHQNYGGAQVYVQQEGRTPVFAANGKYAVAVNPVRLSLDLIEKSFEYENLSNSLDQGPSLVSRREYLGDYSDLLAVCKSYATKILKVSLESHSGETKIMYFTESDAVDVPPETASSVKNETYVFTKSNRLDIVVESSFGVVVGFKIQHIEITLWLRIRTWIVSLFQNIFTWIFSRRSNSTT